MRISVIIPALNEAQRLPGLITALKAEAGLHEIIVVDGASGDGSAQVARQAGATVLDSRPGRGHQVALGAAQATGDVMLFLHADSCFPTGGLAAIDAALSAAPESPGGNFRLLFDGEDDFSRWLDDFYDRIRRRGIYYGDSGIFVRREVYERLGGVRPIELMEDYDFVRRLERAGPTRCIDTPALVTSSRRFRGRGKWSIIRGWLWIHLLYYLGISPKMMAWFYDSSRRHQRPAVTTAAEPR